MRLTISQSYGLVLTIVLFAPLGDRSAHSAEIPKIQTNCRAISDTALPVLPLRFPPTAYRVEPEHLAQVKKIQSLIQAKRWEQALLEFQSGSSWVQDETIRPLFVALVQANEPTRASRFVIEKFPPHSQKRAEGISAISAELIHRNQISDAIALLKNLPSNSDHLSNAIVPIVEALTATNQIKSIPEVMSLFPVEREKWTVWTDVGHEVSFEPAQAREVASMIGDAYLRSMVRSNMAGRWLKNRSVLKAWTIASEIEDCSKRADTFLSVLKELKNSDLNLSSTQQAQALDQLEALIAAIPNPEDVFPSPIHLRLSLSKLNIQNGRKPQGTKLLEQVAQSLKPSDSEVFRTVTLIEIASQYQAMNNRRMAVQILDSAVTATRAAYQPKTPQPGQISWSRPPATWGEEQFTKIAKMYRSLNQVQKAEAIERTLPKRPQVKPLVLPKVEPSSSTPVPSLPSR